jgi:hypothetical protein
VRLPTVKDRISIVGRTGTGKTVAAAWHLLNQPFTEMPWIVYNFKGDELLEELEALEGSQRLDLGTVPEAPGLYFTHPLPHEADRVEEQLWGVWNRHWTGLFIDEGYMLTGSDAYRAILTQGRTLRIPVISLSQRPVWMDKFSFTEASYYQVFALNNRGDRIKMMEYVPADLTKKLPEFHSYYHDVAEESTVVLRPVPSPKVIVERFRAKMEEARPKRRVQVL